MSPPRAVSRKAAWLLVATMAALALVACGSEERKTTGEEGEFIHAGEAVYQVQLTRLLNPRQRPDDTLVRGQLTPPADEQFLAVFVKVQNEGDEPYSPPRDLRVVDSEGNEYLPLDASQSGFGLDFGQPIEPGGEAPPANSPAASGPNGAAMVLFRIKTQSATDNLPLELEIPAAGEEDPSQITLDV